MQPNVIVGLVTLCATQRNRELVARVGDVGCELGDPNPGNRKVAARRGAMEAAEVAGGRRFSWWETRIGFTGR